MSAAVKSIADDGMDALSMLVARKLGGFLATLRDNHFAVGLKEGQDAARIMATGYTARPEALRAAFKHLLCTRKSDWDRFDGLFEAYWLGVRVRQRSLVSNAAQPANSPSLKSLQDSSQGKDERPASDQASVDAEAPERRSGEGRAEGASRAESLDEIDFRKMTDPAQIEEAHLVAARLAKAMRTRLTRRDLARRRGRGLHLRRTIHKNVSHGGAAISLVRRQRKEKPLRLVVLLDASGSMSLYTGIFVRFIHGVLDAFREAEAFVFHTRLAHVSDAMREKDPARALDRLSVMAQGAGGGTESGNRSRPSIAGMHGASSIHAPA